MRLIDADRLEVRLVVETAGGIVLARRVAGRDVER
jgi:hypothetical protein